MKRNLGPEYGVEGEYFVDGDDYGINEGPGIIEHNSPPSTQPSLWCQWIPTEDRMGLEWDDGEKFYKAEEWMNYILNRILAPKGYIGNGIIEAQGEDINDRWWLVVKNNVVSNESLGAKLEAYDILICPKDDLPLFVGRELGPLANKHLKERFSRD